MITIVIATGTVSGLQITTSPIPIQPFEEIDGALTSTLILAAPSEETLRRSMFTMTSSYKEGCFLRPILLPHENDA
jgi:hypothetical protein